MKWPLTSFGWQNRAPRGYWWRQAPRFRHCCSPHLKHKRAGQRYPTRRILQRGLWWFVRLGSGSVSESAHPASAPGTLSWCGAQPRSRSHFWSHTESPPRQWKWWRVSAGGPGQTSSSPVLQNQGEMEKRWTWHRISQKKSGDRLLIKESKSINKMKQIWNCAETMQDCILYL